MEIGAILRLLCEWKGVKIIGRGVSRSRTYAWNQLKEDKQMEQMSH